MLVKNELDQDTSNIFNYARSFFSPLSNGAIVIDYNRERGVPLVTLSNT
ncbi:MAG: hypothetical protein ABJG41_17085 [Cyclobacteriaceae bacterium]